MQTPGSFATKPSSSAIKHYGDVQSFLEFFMVCYLPIQMHSFDVLYSLCTHKAQSCARPAHGLVLLAQVSGQLVAQAA